MLFSGSNFERFICVHTKAYTKWKWWLGFAPVLMLHVCNFVSCIMYDTKLSDLRLIMSLYFFTHFYHHRLLNFLKWKVMIFRTNIIMTCLFLAKSETQTKVHSLMAGFKFTNSITWKNITHKSFTFKWYW